MIARDFAGIVLILDAVAIGDPTASDLQPSES